MAEATDARKILSWGANSYGQLALYHQEDILHPCEVNLANVEISPVTITGGGGHTLILTTSGQCFACGSNSKGQLGVGTEYMKRDVTSPLPVAGALSHNDVTRVAGGWDFTLAITGKGELYGFGSNGFGQLGCPNAGALCCCATLVESLSGVRVDDVSCGMRHSAVLTGDGSIWTCGVGKKGQLGWLSTDGNICSKSPQFVRVDLPGGYGRAVKVIAGSQHTVALTDTGQVFTWGDNKYGQLSHNPASCNQLDTPTVVPQEAFHLLRVVEIHSGWAHVLAVTGDGHVYSWGRSDYGQTGRTNQIASDGHQWQPGRLVIPRPAMIACGSEHNLCASVDGKLYTWGWNEHGMCATGDEVNVLSPKQVTTLKSKVVDIGSGAGHSFAITEE